MDSFVEKIQLAFIQEQQKQVDSTAKLLESQSSTTATTELTKTTSESQLPSQMIDLSKKSSSESLKDPKAMKINEYPVNLEFVIVALNQYLDCVNTNITNQFTYDNLIGLFKLAINLETIKKLLSKNIVFKNLVKNKTMLSELINKYIKMKDLASEFKKSVNSNVIECSKTEKVKFLLNDFCEGISVTCSNFVSSR